MCGRYALALPPSAIVQRLINNGMLSVDAPDDEEIRETYNFAPGYYGLVYRADVPDFGGGTRSRQQNSDEPSESDQNNSSKEDYQETSEPQYKLQAMKWGLIPFWTKRNPDYGSLMRTINCRDDSLAQKGGMWESMKRRKRCIVIAQGFYEWLKKNDGKEKIPHYIRRKDGNLMCMAGLWDCVKYEDTEDKLYSYTIITTDNNKEMAFLHDRMPVILEAGSKEMFTWLDPQRSSWSNELQSLLKPFQGGLDIYPVSKEVGKVGNNSPNFIIPVNSKENKNNIANFFGNQKKAARSEKIRAEPAVKSETLSPEDARQQESEAPLPNEDSRQADLEVSDQAEMGKNKRSESSNDFPDATPPTKARKIDRASYLKSPNKSAPSTPERKGKSVASPAKTSPFKASPVKASPGNSKITSFFSK